MRWLHRPRRKVVPFAREDHIKVTVQRMTPNGTVIWTIWGKGEDLAEALIHCRTQAKQTFRVVNEVLPALLAENEPTEGNDV